MLDQGPFGCAFVSSSIRNLASSIDLVQVQNFCRAVLI